jgi:hypothetical protein
MSSDIIHLISGKTPKTYNHQLIPSPKKENEPTFTAVAHSLAWDSGVDYL